MIEVEVKAKINDFNLVKKSLKEIDAKKSHIEHQEDSYFASPIKDFAKTDEALRIREIKINKKTKTVITYKGPKIDAKSKTREEIELGIEDPKKMERVFEHLGFKKVAKVIKKRTIYLLDEYIISLDEVEGLGPYMEIETDLEDGTNYEKELEKIFDIFKKLKITEGFERTSYLELLENKKIK